ncbi:hypothetical protein GCM10027403_12910 [Arthrobacter tecti]
MNTTVNRPGALTVNKHHVLDGRTQACVDEGDQHAALWLWLTPEVAAQWITALQPLADQAKAEVPC